MPKLNFDETLTLICDGRPVEANDVRKSALLRKLYVAQNSFPGCLPESQSYCSTKEQAVDCLLWVADDGDGPPRGMVTSLRKHGWFHHNGLNYSIAKMRLGDIL